MPRERSPICLPVERGLQNLTLSPVTLVGLAEEIQVVKDINIDSFTALERDTVAEECEAHPIQRHFLSGFQEAFIKASSMHWAFLFIPLPKLLLSFLLL